MPPPRLLLDPSRPYQLDEGLLAIWLPRGCGRDDRARGLVATVDVCPSPTCRCTEARLTAAEIDDRAEWWGFRGKNVAIAWRVAGEAPKTAFHHLTLDFLDGRVTGPDGSAVPELLQPYFQRPVPAWVLDDICERWARSRRLPEGLRDEQALRDWQPGHMLSILGTCPERRFDVFVHEGKRYLVDLVFCVEPGCTCTANRFVVFVEGPISGGVAAWTEIASAELDDRLIPRRTECAPSYGWAIPALYVLWRERAGNAKARFEELRQRALERGGELHALWRERARTGAATPGHSATAGTARPTAGRHTPRPKAESGAPGSGSALGAAVEATTPQPSGKPGRNDPCLCGSGKKHKRCCGA